MHFPEHGKVVEPRIGAGVGCKDNSIIEAKANTIGHGRNTLCSRFWRLDGLFPNSILEMHK
jgi:hypothetical protein